MSARGLRLKWAILKHSYRPFQFCGVSRNYEVLLSTKVLQQNSAAGVGCKCSSTSKEVEKGTEGLLRNNRQELGARRLSVCKNPLFQQASEDDDKDSKSKPKTEPENPYDQKKDTFFTQDTAFGSSENKGLGDPKRPVFTPEVESNSTEEDLTPPTNCCMSGCANCVWIEFVEKLSKIYTDPKMSRERILKDLDAMEDQNIKAFIMMELRTKKLI